MNGKAIWITSMEEKDLPQIQKLYWELVPEGCSIKTLLANYRRTAHRENYALLVAKYGDEILGTAIGIVCIALDTPFLVVENVVVKEECRGLGIGRRIMEELDGFAVERGCQYAILASSGFRKNAHRFYEAAGYTDDVRGFRKYYKK